MEKRDWSQLVGVIAAPALSARRFAVLGVGECSIDEVFLVDRLPQPGEKIVARDRFALGGGQVATALVAAQRLGLRTAFCGAVGEDANGRAIAAGLAEEGVDLDALVQVAGAASRSAAIFVEPSGERTIVERRDAQLAGATLTVPHEIAAVVHADATVGPATLAGVLAAQAAGALLSIDVERPTPVARELVTAADLVVVSEQYFVPERGRTWQAAARALAQTARGVVIVTRGERGVAVATRDGVQELAGFVVPVVDTTACGDTFRGALLVALFAQLPLPGALRFSCAAAAAKCRDYGRRGCPRPEDVVKLLDG